MSYILEALKQSEHARQQGKAPDLNSLPPLLAPPRQSARRPPAYLLLALGLSLAGAGLGLGWWRPWQTAEIVVLAAQAPRSEAPSPPSAPAAPPKAAAPVEPAATPFALARPPTRAPQAPLIRLDPQPAAPGPAQPLVSAPPAVQPEPTLPAPSGRVLGFHELPDELRQSLPTLAVSGFSYADEPQLRMAVINGRILHQRDQVAPGVVVERIASDGVVLNYRGFRFRPR